DVLHRALERGDRIPTRLPLDVGERVVDDALGHGALAALEHLVDDLGDDDRPVDRVGNEVTTRGRTLPGHERSAFPLRAVTAASLLAVVDARRVERPAHDLVAHTGEVLHAATTHQHDRVLLEVVPDPGDVGRDLDARRQPDAGHLAQRGV